MKQAAVKFLKQITIIGRKDNRCECDWLFGQTDIHTILHNFIAERIHSYQLRRVIGTGDGELHSSELVRAHLITHTAMPKNDMTADSNKRTAN